MSVWVALGLALIGAALIKEFTEWTIFNVVLSDRVIDRTEIENVLQKYRSVLKQRENYTIEDGKLLSCIKELEGLWKENNSRRVNMDNFLSATGANVFVRKAAILGNWETVMEINFEGNKVTMNGTRGPKHIPFYDPKVFDTLIVDNHTRTELNLKPIISDTVYATADAQNHTLTSYVVDPKTNITLLVSRLTVLPEKPEDLLMHVIHIPTNTITKSVYKKAPN